MMSNHPLTAGQDGRRGNARKSKALGDRGGKRSAGTTLQNSPVAGEHSTSVGGVVESATVLSSESMATALAGTPVARG